MAYTTIDDPEAHFQVEIYTGDGQENRGVVLSGDTDLPPDLVWIKNRDASNQAHVFYDRVRGATKRLLTNSTGGESTKSSGVQAFNTDGFDVGNIGANNSNSVAYVSYCWKAGGTGSANTDGGTNTTATSANTTAGFSINKWPGSSSSSVQTVGHGLGVAPSWVLTKNTGSGSSITAWVNYHKGLDSSAAEDYLVYLNNTDARTDNSVHGDTAPTANVFSFNTGSDDQDYISYCWAQIKGFSKFGHYTGNGANEGPFVYCGFRPSFVLVKRRSGTGNWQLADFKRLGSTNFMPETLYPNSQLDEQNEGDFDFLSTGFKIRSTGTDANGNGDAYIFMAFANAPTVNSKGIPVGGYSNTGA